MTEGGDAGMDHRSACDMQSVQAKSEHRCANTSSLAVQDVGAGG